MLSRCWCLSLNGPIGSPGKGKSAPREASGGRTVVDSNRGSFAFYVVFDVSQISLPNWYPQPLL
jgi:hypothetical protein